jgi:hypothetical protein
LPDTKTKNPPIRFIGAPGRGGATGGGKGFGIGLDGGRRQGYGFGELGGFGVFGGHGSAKYTRFLVPRSKMIGRKSR